MSLAVNVQEKVTRLCLKCNKPFLSVSRSNRICRRCNRINDALAVPEDVIAAERGLKYRHGEVIVPPSK